MEDNKKLVNFNFWCPLCRFIDVSPGEEPCDTCLEVGGRENTTRPIKFFAKDRDKVKKVLNESKEEKEG